MWIAADAAASLASVINAVCRSGRAPLGRAIVGPGPDAVRALAARMLTAMLRALHPEVLRRDVREADGAGAQVGHVGGQTTASIDRCGDGHGCKQWHHVA